MMGGVYNPSASVSAGMYCFFSFFANHRYVEPWCLRRDNLLSLPKHSWKHCDVLLEILSGMALIYLETLSWTVICLFAAVWPQLIYMQSEPNMRCIEEMFIFEQIHSIQKSATLPFYFTKWAGGVMKVCLSSSGWVKYRCSDLYDYFSRIMWCLRYINTCMSLQPAGLLGDALTSTTQHQLGAHITSCCLSRCFTAVGELAHTQRSRAKKKEKKARDSVMHWVRGMPNYNHLWWYNHSSVKLHSRLIYPLSYHCAVLSLSLSLSLWYEWNWQSDFREPSLNFVWRVFIIPRVSFSG